MLDLWEEQMSRMPQFQVGFECFFAIQLKVFKWKSNCAVTLKGRELWNLSFDRKIIISSIRNNIALTEAKFYSFPLKYNNNHKQLLFHCYFIHLVIDQVEMMKHNWLYLKRHQSNWGFPVKGKEVVGKENSSPTFVYI